MTDSRTNEEWLYALNTSGEIQETALTDLRDLLLRAALYFFNRNLSDFGGINRNEILQYAEDCAQEALIAITKHLSDFRGDSKFTTWAYKFAINMALMTARRERWKEKSIEELTSFSNGKLVEWTTADHSALQKEISDIIHVVIEQDLTEKQRQVLIMMVFNEVPMDEVVQRLGTNRNAIYKMLHDARRKLKSSLQRRGFEISELQALFHDPG